MLLARGIKRLQSGFLCPASCADRAIQACSSNVGPV